MLTYLLAFLITYIVTTLFGYIIHWSLHQKWTGRFNQSHMTHHILYPPEDYISDKYRGAGKDDTSIIFAFASLPILILPIVLGVFSILAWPLVIAIIVIELLLGFVHWYIHDAFHIKNHWMGRVPVLRDIFQVWNRLHYLHHVDTRTNYGIFVFHWDRIFRTFWKSFAVSKPD